MKYYNWIVLGFLVAILMCGVFFIYSASSIKIGDNLTTENYFIKQIIWIFISFLLLFAIIKTPLQIIDIAIIPLYIISVIALIIVLFLPEINGSHRWFSLGFISFQPSELAKLSVVLLVAKSISKPFIRDVEILRNAFLILIMPLILILLEPDLGTALTLIVSVIAILTVSDLPIFYLLILISPIFSIITSFSIYVYIFYIAILVLILFRANLSKIIIGFTVVFNSFFFFITPVIWNGLKEYQQNRILSFINPMRNPFGSGYQIIQSKIAIGSGGIFGKGYLLGSQKNLNFIPEHHTDFIFSVIGEEFGFLGCLFLLSLLFLFFYNLMKIIVDLKRNEFRFGAVGIFSYLLFQILINVGMNIGIMPTTGIPLPFVSYGGSSLLMNILGIGLILKYFNEKSIFK